MHTKARVRIVIRREPGCERSNEMQKRDPPLSLSLSLPPPKLDTYLGIMDRDGGRVLERHAARVTVKRYRYDRCLGVVEVTEGQFIAARREP